MHLRMRRISAIIGSAVFFVLAPCTVAGFVPGPGRLAMFLEGGYDLAALRASVRATLASVLGVACEMEDPSSGGPGMDRVQRAKSERDGALEMMHRAAQEQAQS